MLLALVAAGLLLLWLLTSWTLARVFDEFGRSVVLDDLGEYQAVYEREGIAAIRHVHRLIGIALGVTTLLAVGPALWFANRVLRPVRELTAKARRLVRTGPTIERLTGSMAIPELRELAAAFNQGLDQVQVVTQELEAANDQLAHELRTPLARIRGNVEKVLSLTDAPSVRDQAARAIDEIDRATRLIHAILTIRAGEARTLKLQLGSVRLGELVEATVDLYSAAAEEKGLELRQAGAGSGLVVWGDGDRLQQALCNLLDNALACTPQGGTVQVAVRGEDRFAVVSVADTGPGLSGTDPERIWRRFTRGSAASAEVPGIGLGLSVVRSIVRAHHGEAGARNRAGGGAEFWIRIPLAPPTATAGATPRAATRMPTSQSAPPG